MKVPAKNSISTEIEKLQRNYYLNGYSNCHYTGILGKFTNGYHKLLEKSKYVARLQNPRVLEVGGGLGTHIPFVSQDFSSYVLTDIKMRENLSNAKLVCDPQILPKVQFRVANATNLNFAENSFDRLISTCLLHHVTNVDSALSEWRRVVRSGGIISIYLPCDPGMLYRWTRNVTSHFKQARKMKMSLFEVKYLWANEHKNHFLGIYKILMWQYRDDVVKIKRFPFPGLSWNFNLYLIIQIKVIK
jgi:phosphatidylethanolamine/phosphatidyl-N-methylethanolamine N-methyltransferase